LLWVGGQGTLPIKKFLPRKKENIKKEQWRNDIYRAVESQKRHGGKEKTALALRRRNEREARKSPEKNKKTPTGTAAPNHLRGPDTF